MLGPDFSVILPTRNRAGQLSGALAHLARQETGGAFTYEVVVIDNGSTDDTRATVERVAAGYPVPLVYVYESRAGKPQALNAGMQAATGSLFAFLDDDVEPVSG